MKAAIALLGDLEVYNLVRKLAWEIHLRCQTGTRHATLPPHISLKQPFAIADLPGLEAYLAELAGSITPFEVTLSEIQVQPLPYGEATYGLLWLDVQETPALRQLHDRVNRELNQRFGGTQAVYDGPDYHFHLTVTLGGQPVEVYRQFLAEQPETRLNLAFTPRQLALFLYDEPMGLQGDYLCYKILPLGMH